MPRSLQTIRADITEARLGLQGPLERILECAAAMEEMPVNEASFAVRENLERAQRLIDDAAADLSYAERCVAKVRQPGRHREAAK